MKFARIVLDGLSGQKRLPFGNGALVFRTTKEFDISLPADGAADWPAPDQSNSTVVIGRIAIVKLFRRCVIGIHPEAEMIRFLTERGFNGIAALLGEVTRVFADGEESLMAIAQRFVANQGDGFRWTVDQLERVRDDQSVAANPEAKHFELYENFAHRLGVRLGQMHQLLAQPCDNPDFAPETADAASLSAWREQARRQLEHAFEILSKARPRDAVPAERQVAVLRAADEALSLGDGLLKTRVHGDLHLGQVLVAAGDIIFIDFEGEPLKPLAERRAKTSPLRDVAGMLRSFDYAARIVERGSKSLEGSTGADLARSLTSEFRRLATRQFLLGYAEGRGAPLAESELKLITVFALEKAAYEVVYEATYRPDWLDVPVKGFAILTGEILGVGA
jgi:maltose alpha-D-glucosyltransferase/alpha-amylase